MVGMRQNIPSLRGTALSRGLSPRSLGVEMTVKRMEPFGTLNLATRPLVGFASNSGFTSVTFGNHFFVMNGQKVFDSCVGPVVGEEIDQYLSGSVSPSCPHGTINDIEDFEYVEHFK